MQAMRTEPIVHPAAWTGAALGGREAITRRLSGEELAGLDALLAATARSHMATSWQPAAVAMPCTRAMTGTGSCCRPCITALHWANNFW